MVGVEFKQSPKLSRLLVNMIHNNIVGVQTRTINKIKVIVKSMVERVQEAIYQRRGVTDWNWAENSPITVKNKELKGLAITNNPLLEYGKLADNFTMSNEKIKYINVGIARYVSHYHIEVGLKNPNYIHHSDNDGEEVTYKKLLQWMEYGAYNVKAGTLTPPRPIFSNLEKEYSKFFSILN